MLLLSEYLILPLFVRDWCRSGLSLTVSCFSVCPLRTGSGPERTPKCFCQQGSSEQMNQSQYDHAHPRMDKQFYSFRTLNSAPATTSSNRPCTQTPRDDGTLDSIISSIIHQQEMTNHILYFYRFRFFPFFIQTQAVYMWKGAQDCVQSKNPSLKKYCLSWSNNGNTWTRSLSLIIYTLHEIN